MSALSELDIVVKPCPFCGATGNELYIPYTVVCCIHCGTFGPLPQGELSDIEAVEAWNRRGGKDE
mgnify:FL=1